MNLPARSGLGFKPQHYADILATTPDIGFFEVHAENYMGAGGPPHVMLSLLRQNYAISIHGVGLSIGGSGPLCEEHLARLKAVCDRYEPESFSEHLAWASHGDAFLNDLLPLPYTDETLRLVCDHIDRVQEVLGRKMLLENPATYVQFEQSVIPETDFLAQIVKQTGCGLLLDVNNVFVSCTNHHADPRAYLAAFPMSAVGEIHLGGHSEEELEDGPLLIDAHGTAIADPVWALYSEVINRLGPLPTLVEWDNDLPDFTTLYAEAQRAEKILKERSHALAS